MLKKLGVTEIFLPKIYPSSLRFRSADVDYSEDQYLTIPSDELAILNQVDWYKASNREAWDIANKYFDVVFFIALYPEIFKNVTKYFKGALIWRWNQSAS